MSPALRAELARLTLSERFDLLGELLEPTMGGPFDHAHVEDEEDAVTDALAPVTAAYCAAYADVRAILADAEEKRRKAA